LKLPKEVFFSYPSTDGNLQTVRALDQIEDFSLRELKFMSKGVYGWLYGVLSQHLAMALILSKRFSFKSNIGEKSS
jgi:hypothetical protein